jgi:hypothetical protein
VSRIAIAVVGFIVTFMSDTTKPWTSPADKIVLSTVLNFVNPDAGTCLQPGTPEQVAGYPFNLTAAQAVALVATQASVKLLAALGAV